MKNEPTLRVKRRQTDIRKLGKGVGCYSIFGRRLFVSNSFVKQTVDLVSLTFMSLCEKCTGVVYVPFFGVMVNTQLSG